MAFVVNTGQAELYTHVVKLAASADLRPKAFSHETEAREWLVQSVQLLADNRAWWSSRG